MLIANVISGIRRLATNESTRTKAFHLLRHTGAGRNEAEKLVQDEAKLKEIEGLFLKLSEESLEKGIISLKQVAHIRDEDQHIAALLGGRDPLEEKLNKLIGPSMARSIVNLVGSVVRATPKMAQVGQGPYVKGIKSPRKPLWGETEKSFRIATRPLTYWELLPLIGAIGFKPSPKPQGVDLKDPVLNLSENQMRELIDTLNILSARKFRLPTESEWEKTTGITHAVVPLQSVLTQKKMSFPKFLESCWLKQYGNGFISPTNPSNGHHFCLTMGGMIATEPGDLNMMWRDLQARPRLGLTLYVWDFGTSTIKSPEDEKAWEVVTASQKNAALIQKQVGLRYFSHPDLLRNPSSPFGQNSYSMFRLAEDTPDDVHRTPMMKFIEPGSKNTSAHRLKGNKPDPHR